MLDREGLALAIILPVWHRPHEVTRENDSRTRVVFLPQVLASRHVHEHSSTETGIGLPGLRGRCRPMAGRRHRLHPPSQQCELLILTPVGRPDPHR
jgi:hypothetical protein